MIRSGSCRVVIPRAKVRAKVVVLDERMNDWVPEDDPVREMVKGPIGDLWLLTSDSGAGWRYAGEREFDDRDGYWVSEDEFLEDWNERRMEYAAGQVAKMRRALLGE